MTDQLLNDLQQLATTPNQQLGVQLLAEAFEAGPFGGLRDDLDDVQKQQQDILSRLSTAEECLSSSLPNPAFVSDDDASYVRHLKDLQQQRELDIGNCWHTPSKRAVRQRQLQTLEASWAKANVQLQEAWRKCHEQYAQAEALRSMIAEDAELAASEEKDSEVSCLF